MAAVNKDIEALLARYEKAFEEKTVDDFGSRLKITDRMRNHKHKKENLTPEQMKLLSMDKPPLDKLKELPQEYIENLKPRPPPSHLQREKALTGSKGLKKDLKESFEAFIQKEQGTDNQKSELLESMWKDVVERGLAKEDMHKNIKPVYTSMTLDENASININFGKPLLNQDTQEKKGTSVGTVISPRMKTNPSVATQTTYDNESIINRIRASSSIISGSNKKFEDIHKKSNSECFSDPKKWTGDLKDFDIGDSERKTEMQVGGEKKNISSSSSHTVKSSGDALPCRSTKEMLAQLFESKIDSKSKTKFPTNCAPIQKEFNVFTVQTPDNTDIFRKAGWYRNRNDHLVNSNCLLTKKEGELNINEKMASMMTKNDLEQFAASRSKDIGVEILSKDKTLQESLDQNDLLKNSMLFACRSEQKNMNDRSDISTDQESKMMCSFPTSLNTDSKFMKESTDGVETPLCVEIIKRLTDTMMKCEPGKISEELTNRNCYMCLDELRKLRAQHLMHIQNEVKHIEELDKLLVNLGIAAHLLYTAADKEGCDNRQNDQQSG